MGRLRRRHRAIAPPLVENRGASHDGTADERDEQKDSSCRENSEDDLDADVTGRLRLFRQFDDDRLLSKQDVHDGCGVRLQPDLSAS